MPRIVVELHPSSAWPTSADILIDGISRARLKRNARADLAVDAGEHVIQARSFGAVSKPVHFSVAERESFAFACLSRGLVKKALMIEQVSRQRHKDRF